MDRLIAGFQLNFVLVAQIGNCRMSLIMLLQDDLKLVCWAANTKLKVTAEGNAIAFFFLVNVNN